VAVLTDYGTRDFYVGALEGAMYTANPRVRITTISHHIEPFNVAEGCYVLVQVAREFPPGTVFLAVVNPGVGTARRCILVETPDHKLFIAPDKGLLSGVIEKLGVAHAYEIRNYSLMRQGGCPPHFTAGTSWGQLLLIWQGISSPLRLGRKSQT
jgi:S-adenosylmethionine hydrolase